MGILDRSWYEAVQAAHGHFTKTEQANGWALLMKTDQIAALQQPYRLGYRSQAVQHKLRCMLLLQSINHDCLTGELPCKMVTINENSTYTDVRSLNCKHRPNGALRLSRAPSTNKSKLIEYRVSANRFSTWLQAYDLAPSVHITAWLDAVGFLDS